MTRELSGMTAFVTGSGRGLGRVMAKSLDRYAEPAEIADAVAFLAGLRSKFVNGQVLRVDGGLTLFPG